MGEPPKTPEQILEESELESLLEKTISKFSHEDQNILDEVFDTILQIQQYKDQEQLIKIVVHRMNNKVTEEKVKTLFYQIVKQGPTVNLF